MSNNKHNLIVIGSARGVNRFYAVNSAIEHFKGAKVINTSELIKSIIKDLDLKDLDNIHLLDYFKYVEPMLTKNILAHLEHNDVILDTTYYYLLPGISSREILKFYNKINTVILVLISDKPKKIQATNNLDWFKDINNISDDLLLNEYSFKSYISLFSSFARTTSLTLKTDDVDKINDFFDPKNGQDKK